MHRTPTIISLLVTLSACVTQTTRDLTGYTLEDFQREPAICHLASQCKYIGYGIGNGGCTSSPIFEGFIIYSTKMGELNIEHLKRLAKESRLLGHKTYSDGTILAALEGVDFEVCLPVGNIKPNLRCLKYRCKDICYKEE